MNYNDFKQLNDLLRGKVITGRIVSKIYADTRYCKIQFSTGEIKIVSIDNLLRYIQGGNFCLSNPSVLRTWSWKIKQDNRRIKCLTGSELKQFVDNRTINAKNKRRFVDNIIFYLNSNDNKVYGVVGLRGIGKTTGMMQAMKYINNYDDVLFINILAPVSADYLYNVIEKNIGVKKYIFIDEITLVENFVNFCGYLYDIFSSSGKKVVISGTDTAAIIYAKNASLLHRMSLDYVNFITYNEAISTMSNIHNFDDYLKYGGLYSDYIMTNNIHLKNYIDSSVVDNIIRTISKNEVITHFSHLLEMNNKSDKIRTVVYMIITAVIYSISEKNVNLDIKYILNLFDRGNNDRLKRAIENDLQVDFNMHISSNDVRAVIEVLQDMQVIVPVYNLFDNIGVNYYITNQSVFYQMSRIIYSVTEKQTGIKPKFYGVQSRKMGFVFEAAVMNHAICEANIFGYNIYYYRDIEALGNREVDLIIGCKSENKKDIYNLYEIKMTDNIEEAQRRATWISDIDIEGINVVGRAIVYGGIDEYINKETGVQIIPVVNFVRNMNKYINKIDDSE